MLLDNKQMLPADQITSLRQKNLLTNEEYAYVAGDLLVAENVQTTQKRVIGNATEVLGESRKRVLKG